MRFIEPIWKYHAMHATANFLSNVGLTPEGTCAVTELPDDVQAELNAEAINAGAFWQLVPALLNLFQLLRTEGATVQQIWEQVQVIIAIVRGGASVEELQAEEISFGTILPLIPLIIQIVTLFKSGGGFAEILAKIMELVRQLSPKASPA